MTAGPVSAKLRGAMAKAKSHETKDAKLRRIGLREYCKRKLEERIGREWTSELENDLLDELDSDSETRRDPDLHWREADALDAAIRAAVRIMEETLPADTTGGAIHWRRRAREWGSADLPRDAWMGRAWETRAPGHPGFAKWVARRLGILKELQGELQNFTRGAINAELKGNADIVNVFDIPARIEWRDGQEGFLGTGRNATTLDLTCLSVLLLGHDSEFGQPAVEAFNLKMGAMKKIQRRSISAKMAEFLDDNKSFLAWLGAKPGREALFNQWARSNPLARSMTYGERREAIEAIEAREGTGEQVPR
jgi:hypothetical protein